MKALLTIAVAFLAAAPAQAQINHTGRYYGPNGSYTKCRVIGSQYSSSTHCISGEAARDEDRRMDSRNTCMETINAKYIERYELDHIGTISQEAMSKSTPRGIAYMADVKSCHSANGFN